LTEPPSISGKVDDVPPGKSGVLPRNPNGPAPRLSESGPKRRARKQATEQARKRADGLIQPNLPTVARDPLRVQILSKALVRPICAVEHDLAEKAKIPLYRLERNEAGRGGDWNSVVYVQRALGVTRRFFTELFEHFVQTEEEGKLGTSANRPVRVSAVPPVVPRIETKRLDPRQRQLLEHPLRLGRWELYERDPARSLVPKDLCHDMAPTEEHRPPVSQVNYHLRLLQLLG
jgi:hypothetical protein